MEYRSIPVIWALIELISIISVVFLWLAIYRGQDIVGNYSFKQMLLYYALVPLIGSITDVYVTSSLPKMIKDGRISADLLKPYSLSLVHFLKSTSIKLAQQILKVPIFLAFILFIFFYFQISLDLKNVAIALFFSLFAYVLNFLMDLCLSFAAFWMDEVWSLKHLKFVTQMVFGGMAFPLDILPKTLKNIFNFQPMRFLYYFPIKIASSGESILQITVGFIEVLLWIGFFGILAAFLWKRGIRKYGAYGN